MHSRQTFLHIGALLSCAAGIARAQYSLVDNYDTSNFFNEFSFYSGTDPTNGFVDYQTATAANADGLAGFSSGGIYLGVDDTTLNPSGGRGSVRLSSNKAYTHGLFIADIAHMPGSICGVWPAFWTFGPNWPASGEIDIIEGVNQESVDTITLHTSAGCSVNTAGSAPGTTILTADNCNAGTDASTGCGVSTSNTNAYGNGFNSIGGGVYAMEWTSSSISVWFWPRGSIPSDITAETPNPTGWPTPMTVFTGNTCDIDQHFANHNIIFDTTFCGDWAGEVWGSGSCASAAATCNDFVAQNPSAFSEAYWLINSVKVYQTSGSTRRGLSGKGFAA